MDREERGRALRTRAPKNSTLQERLWFSTEKSDDGCWLWLGAAQSRGYGVMNDKGTIVYVHRLSYEIHFGPVPDGKLVCHHCDNRRCVRPDHFFLGTADDNSKDMLAKERQCRGEAKVEAKLTDEIVRYLRSSESAGYTIAALGRQFGVERVTIRNARKGRTWSHVR